ncbi:unnamed protein product [Mytilus edulis]|uniref:Endonuclease/exonuclease/phosphatase domain-containing protein n=1 Tax=Mytilus edulis TaxID=6550 RepID=A0A8S3V2B3_MYTED|nr:unnamed protein product [Mytilus edulis]
MITDSQIFPPEYNIFQKDRNCSGGGVLVAIKDTYITTALRELQTDCEIVWCKLELIGHNAIYLSSYYNPKTSNENGYLELEKSLTRANNIKNDLIIMAGDFNLLSWGWKTKTLTPTNIQHKFTDILDDHGLQQMVEEPTRELPFRQETSRSCRRGKFDTINVDSGVPQGSVLALRLTYMK